MSVHPFEPMVQRIFDTILNLLLAALSQKLDVFFNTATTHEKFIFYGIILKVAGPCLKTGTFLKVPILFKNCSSLVTEHLGASKKLNGYNLPVSACTCICWLNTRKHKASYETVIRIVPFKNEHFFGRSE